MSGEEKAEIAIVGAGYVGVPLAQVFVEGGKRVVLVDVVQERVDQLLRGESYIEDVPSDVLRVVFEAEPDLIAGLDPSAAR